MRNCVTCNKQLSRHTKGDLCLQCYRNRNNIDEIDNSINADNNPEFPTEDNIIPLYDNNELDDRAVISLLKQKMTQERIRDTEFIDILKSHINFMKAEIINKNQLIDKLCAELIDNQEYIPTRNASRERIDSIINTSTSTSITSSTTSTSITETIDASLSNISRDSLSDTIFNTKDIENNYDRQVANYRFNKHCDFLNNNNDGNKLTANEQSQYDVTETHNINQFGAWEIHSTGFGSKMLKKMGYGGKGLGKSGEGIIHPVTIKEKNKFNPIDKVEQHMIHNYAKKRVINNTHVWPNGTTLITGSSIISGIEEARLKKYKAKVRSFPGSTVSDMYDYLIPLLKKEPSYIILQIGSNDSPFKSHNEIANEISDLKSFINSILPDTKVFISCPVLRLDNMKANRTLRCLDAYLKSSSKEIVVNDNIDGSCIGKKGLHLNPKGSGRLASNYISLMRRL